MKLMLAVFCLSLSTGVASAQAPVPPRPGAEHEILKSDVGTWDVTVESFMPGAPAPMTSKGTETNTLMGGLWLVTDFKADMMGMPFQGHGVTGYDAGKKKYVGTWVDTLSSGLGLSEATWDAASKTMTGTIEAPDPSGQVQKMKSVVTYKDADTRVFTMSGTGPDGKDVKIMTITYTRKK
ncbi:MAG: DUF1579 domain-containing protein [Vicinamibacteria bacterium]